MIANTVQDIFFWIGSVIAWVIWLIGNPKFALSGVTIGHVVFILYILFSSEENYTRKERLKFAGYILVSYVLSMLLIANYVYKIVWIEWGGRNNYWTLVSLWCWANWFLGCVGLYMIVKDKLLPGEDGDNDEDEPGASSDSPPD